MKQIGEESPDRYVQFQHINATATSYMEAASQSFLWTARKRKTSATLRIMVLNTAPKELDHDFPLPELGKAVPYGIYELAQNEEYVNVGIIPDTAVFAVNSIRSWWYNMGMLRYADAGALYITADTGGANCLKHLKA